MLVDYHFVRIQSFARAHLRPTDSEEFLRDIVATASEQIVQSDDRVRIARKIYRFKSAEIARRACDLLDDYFRSSGSKTSIKSEI